MALLPTEARLRACAVCTAWRAALSDPQLWMVLRMPCCKDARAAVAVLRAASRRAAGGLRELHVCGDTFPTDVLREVLAANAGAVRVLRLLCDDGCFTRKPKALLRAAPEMQSLEADVCCIGVASACRLLRNEPPYGPLHMRTLMLGTSNKESEHGPARRKWASLLAALAAHAHASLTRLHIVGLMLSVQHLEALVDAALARRISALGFENCALSPAHVPALARLLRGGTLAELHLCGFTAEELRGNAGNAAHAAAWSELCVALRGCATLRRLTCEGLAEACASALCEMLGALVAHPALARLRICSNCDDDDDEGSDMRENDMQLAVGSALAALLAADAPSLRECEVADLFLWETGLRPLLHALRSNVHLRRLECWWEWGGEEDAAMMDATFAEAVLLPAVRANRGLRTLRLLPPRYSDFSLEVADTYFDSDSEEEDAALNDAYFYEERDVLVALATAEACVRDRDDEAVRQAAAAWAVAYRRWTAPSS
jgi:hypothetical protein